MGEIKTNKGHCDRGVSSPPYEISFGESCLSRRELGNRKRVGNIYIYDIVRRRKVLWNIRERRRVGTVENRLREAALFLVPTIYTSIRNNDGCRRMEQERELLDANAPGSLMEPIFNSTGIIFFLFLLPYHFLSLSLTHTLFIGLSLYVRFFSLHAYIPKLHTNFPEKRLTLISSMIVNSFGCHGVNCDYSPYIKYIVRESLAQANTVFFFY